MDARTRPFRDRREAGRVLAARLTAYAGRTDAIVLALPRGGVPVGFEVASALGLPLDLFLVRKLGVPGREELAMGAIASGGARVLNPDVVRSLGLSQREIESVAESELRELARREQLYRGDRPRHLLAGCIAIVVDDGLATGASMRVAVAGLRQQRPARVVVAVPVAAPASCAELAREADEVVCVVSPPGFLAVGAWYEDFSQTSDAEVRELLARAAYAVRS